VLSTVVAVFLVVVVVLGSLRFGVARSRLPERGSLTETVPGCPAEVTIRFDGLGVAHIRTDDEEALWFAQGYTHARDRFFQMEMARRLASGRLAEVVGSAALPSDRRFRTWRIGATARRQAALLDAQSKAVLEAYSDGVNAAVEAFGPWIAPEIWLLGHHPEPWSPESSLEVALLLQLDLSWSMGEEFKRAVELRRLGRDRAVELWGWTRNEQRSWIPAGETGEAPRREHEPIRPPLSGFGSNNWALAPEKTRTGRAILATDPHLDVTMPGPLAMIHLNGPGIHVTGASVPGAPGVLIGHNEHVAWAFTMAMLDDQDLFRVTFDETGENELVDGVWLRVRTVTEEIRTRWNAEPELHKVRLSEYGPLVRDEGDRALALAWTGHSGTGMVRALLDLNRAVSVEEAASAWTGVIGPSLNLVAADTGGHILHQVVGLVPDRGRGAGRVPAPGADSRWAWRGFLPMERNPRSVDPDAGFVATANHDFYAEGDVSVGSRLPGDFAAPWRVRRIRKMLAARNDWDTAATFELQRDEVSDRAVAVLKLLRPDLEDHGGSSAALLLDWNGEMDAASVAPHVFSQLIADLDRAVGGDDLGGGSVGAEALLRLLAGGLGDDWWDDRNTANVEDRRAILTRVLDTLDARTEAETWGEVHQVVFRHPLTDLPVAGRLLAGPWNRGPITVGGDNVTISAHYSSRRRPYQVAAMPAFRMVCDVGRWDDSIAVMPLGQSGRPWSSHYADQIAPWLRGEPAGMPFSEAAVESATEARLTLRPEE
jgi:penicillin amidase